MLCLGSQPFWQRLDDDIVGYLQAVAHLVVACVKVYQNLRFVEIRRFGRSTGVDQHCGGLDAVSFGAHAVDPVAKTSEHFAAHFPTIQLGCGVSCCRTCKYGAYLIDGVTVHRTKMDQRDRIYNHDDVGGAFARDKCGRPEKTANGQFGGGLHGVVA